MLKLKNKFDKFKKALIALSAIYLKPIQEDRANIDATIQRFEFSFELAWKLLQEYFLKNDIQLHYPKEVLKEAYEVGIIDNQEIWLKMLHDRNLSSHTYNEKLADEIHLRIKTYVPELTKLMNKMGKYADMNPNFS